jgi:hypothetical protein
MEGGGEKQEEDNPHDFGSNEGEILCVFTVSKKSDPRFRISFRSFHHAQQLSELKEMYT